MGLWFVAGCDEVGADEPGGPRAVVVADEPDRAVLCASEGLGLCDAVCVDLALDARHCGGCGQACATGEACVAGWCEPPCPPGQIRCDGACVERTRASGPGSDARTFAFTGAPQRFVVPECVAAITVELWGAQGGGSRCCDSDGGALQDDGGRGAYVRGELVVEPGEVLQIHVGGRGGVDGAAGWNGGGSGGEFAGGGGGASDIRRGGGLQDRILVAGGGGGGQCGCPDHGAGGPGGLLVGGAGLSFYAEWDPAGGGTQGAGGGAGTLPGTAGALGLGGGAPLYHVAGGGGGFYGGGSAYAAGGGGGSSRIMGGPLAQSLPGVRAGDGLVRITW